MLITARENDVWLLGLKLAERILICRHLEKGKYPKECTDEKRGSVLDCGHMEKGRKP